MEPRGVGKTLLLLLAALFAWAVGAATYDFQGCTVTASGATGKTVGSDLVLTFTQSGSLSVASDVRADILVVGGGGGGGGAYYGSVSKYNGNGGNGGSVQYVAGETLPADTAMTVTVGAAGSGGGGVGKNNTAKSGAAGTESSLKIASAKTVLASGGAGGAGGTSRSNGNAGSNGTGYGNYDISGTSVAYGAAGEKAGSSAATDATAANGQGGQGGYRSSKQASRAGGKGGAGVVIVRLKEVLASREPIEKPTAATGLVYDGTMQTGVAPGEHYTLVGTYRAKDANSYDVTVTPESGYCWKDNTYGAIKLTWTIARRPVTVSVLPSSKTVGEEEPVYPTKVEGFVGGDATETEVSWKVWRTDLVEQSDGSLAPNETVGKYDLAVSGTAQTANYAITYVDGPGAFEILPAIVEIAVPTGATGLVYDGKSKTGVAEGAGYVLSGTVTAVDAGAYSATATLLEGYCWAGGSTEAKKIEWSIAKADYDMGNVVFQHKAAVYDGQVQAMSVTGPLPDGVTVAYENNANKNVGLYAVTAKFTGDTKNHNPIGDLTADLAIEPLTITVTPVAGQEKTLGTAYTILFTTSVALVGTDVFTGGLSPEAESVGTQRIVLGTLAIDDGNGGENYTLMFDETVTITVKSPPPSISEDEGRIDYDPTTKEVVVSPDAGVKDVEIVNMPEDATAQVPVSVDTVKGVTAEQVVVVAEATNETGVVKVDITDAFAVVETPAGVTIRLDDDPAAAVEVEIADAKETIRVKPELTESGDAVVEPMEVATESVGLGVKTIPGLTYRLKRSTTPGGASETVASETAKGTRTKLTDPMEGEKPSRAFYVIEVTK